MRRILAFSIVVLLLPSVVLASGEDPALPLLLYLVLILLAVKLMGHLGVLLGQPAVLGELCAGILLGNPGFLGIGGFEGIASDPFVDILARIGVIVLLFEVGLESTIREIFGVGVSSLLVAILGVAAPFGLGWLVGTWFLPESSPYVHAFLGATLCATSVGITARVLQDIGKSRAKEARIILGAAVIDDVFGLVILASVSGVILASEGGRIPGLWPQVLIVLKAGGVLAGSLLLGTLLTPKIFSTAAKLRGPGVLVGISLAFCFLLAYLTGLAGLAPIVGAFAAGLLLAPVFFVQMGAKVDLGVFASPGTLWLALALTVAAILGKQLCSLGVLEKGANRWAVGFGMIPRGEVGLIFASIGATLVLGGERIIDATTYSAVIIMVILTTLVTPPLLKWSLISRNIPGKEQEKHAGPA